MALSASVGFFLISRARVNISAFALKNISFSITFFIIPIIQSKIINNYPELKPLSLRERGWGEAG